MSVAGGRRTGVHRRAGAGGYLTNAMTRTPLPGCHRRARGGYLSSIMLLSFALVVFIINPSGATWRTSSLISPVGRVFSNES